MSCLKTHAVNDVGSCVTLRAGAVICLAVSCYLKRRYTYFAISGLAGQLQRKRV